MPNHALLSASSSHRWLNCPPSARLCEGYDDKGSDFAAEGTDAHALCEFKLRTALGMEAKDPTEDLTWYNSEMEECANGYVEVNRAILGHLDLDCKNGMITYHMLPNSYGKVLDVRCKNGVITVDGVHTTNGHYQTRIPSRNDSKHELSVVASCNNGIVKMKGFE